MNALMNALNNVVPYVKATTKVATTALKWGAWCGTGYIVYQIATADDEETYHEKLNAERNAALMREIVAVIEAQEKQRNQSISPKTVSVGGKDLPVKPSDKKEELK